MNEYRVTKYNPALRDSAGVYRRDEWTSMKDIGRSFGGVPLTRGEYESVEGAYVEGAIAFLREAGVNVLRVEGLENAGGQVNPIRDGTILPLEHVADIIRKMLREELWCRLKGEDAFVHVGWDFYMYLGVPCPCPAAQMRATELGLYVEEFSSPYSQPSVS